MKLSYFGYCLYDYEQEICISFDIRPIIRGFCNGATVAFKNSIEYNSEKVFLFQRTANIFLFAITRDSEIIKKINTQELTVEELHDILQRNEKLGFASYVYIGTRFIGIASTFYAPRIKAFIEFFNTILKSTRNGRYCLYVEALLHKSTREEILAFPTVSSTTVRISRDSPLFDRLGGFFTGNDNGIIDVDCFEVKLMPRKGGEITTTFRELAARIPDEGLRKFTVRAKSAFDEIMTDYYLEGKGALSDFISSLNEDGICQEISERIRQNALLNEKIEDFIDREECQNVDIPSVSRYSVPGPWANIPLAL